MRKILAVIAAVLCLSAFCILLPEPSGSQKRGAGQVAKAGMLLRGSASDQGYTQCLYEAAESVCALMGLELSWQDQIPAGGAFTRAAEQMIAEGCGLILSDSDQFDADLSALAPAHPGVCFLNISGTAAADNLAVCQGRAYQVRYLCGMAAGLQTRTNEIGYVLSVLTPETIRQLNAFTIGVRKVNPDAVVYVRHTDDWNDGEKAASVTAMLLDAHNIDVLTDHVNPVSPLRVADERGVYTIGNNRDSRALFPRTFLTGCVYDWEPFLAGQIADCIRHRFTGGTRWEGIRTGLVSLAPLTERVNAGTGEIVSAELNRLMRGEYDVFYGPVTDIYGTVQIRAGENISDEQLLYGMYWYVDGVVME